MWTQKVSSTGKTVRHFFNGEHLKMILVEHPGNANYLLVVRSKLTKHALTYTLIAENSEEAQNMAYGYVVDLLTNHSKIIDQVFEDIRGYIKSVD